MKLVACQTKTGSFVGGVLARYFQVKSISPLSLTDTHLRSGIGGTTVILILATPTPFAGQKSS